MRAGTANKSKIEQITAHISVILHKYLSPKKNTYRKDHFLL